MNRLRRLFARSAARPRPTFRPQLEAFEDRCVPAVVAASFHAYGVYRVDSNGATQLTSVYADQVATDALGDVVGNFPGYGVWRYRDGVGWQQLAGLNVDSLDARGNGYVAVYLGNYGIFEWSDSTGWQQLTGVIGHPTQVKVDDYGDVLANVSTWGAYYHANGGNWVLVYGGNVKSCDIAGSAQMVFSISGVGVYRFSYSSGWQQATTSVADLVKTNARGDLVGTFGSYGVYENLTSSGSWRRLTDEAFCDAIGLTNDGIATASLSRSGVVGWDTNGTEGQWVPIQADSMSCQE
jgi:hypothetical protein